MAHGSVRTSAHPPRRLALLLTLALALAGVAPGVGATADPPAPDPATGLLPEVGGTPGAATTDVATTDAAVTIGVPQPACTPGALIRSVATAKPYVALTFDDGPWPTNTRAVMDALKSKGLESMATFYMIGINVKAYPSIAREVAARGYDIGNHSMTHKYTSSVIASEIAPTQVLLRDVTGITPDTFRSPGLTEGTAIQNELRRLGLCNVFTRFNPNDSAMPRISAWQICTNIRTTSGPATSCSCTTEAPTPTP